jgi:uncharacterized membrane protein YoaK (UPF0700 family)
MRVLTEVASMIGVLIVGIVVGSFLAGSAALWPIVVVLAVVALVIQGVAIVQRSRKPAPTT